MTNRLKTKTKQVNKKYKKKKNYVKNDHLSKLCFYVDILRGWYLIYIKLYLLLIAINMPIYSYYIIRIPMCIKTVYLLKVGFNHTVEILNRNFNNQHITICIFNPILGWLCKCIMYMIIITKIYIVYICSVVYFMIKCIYIIYI